MMEYSRFQERMSQAVYVNVRIFLKKIRVALTVQITAKFGNDFAQATPA